jgi:NAD(P)-dependent dehydrogenase (short-subunit alcohol dehydrogenase family)
VRSVIITGVSRGLGAALFDEFDAAGDRILAVGRRFTDSQYATERANQRRIRLRPADLAHPASLPPASELASFVHDATDMVLVHNAAVVGAVGAIGTLTPEQIQLAVAVNFTAPMLLTNALLGAGALNQSGRSVTVLYISAEAARRPVGGWSVYGATKRGGEAFVESLAAQHAGDARMRVISLDPGAMDTQLQADVRGYAGRDIYFPERDRYTDLHQRGALIPPAHAAKQIIGSYLTP